MNLALVAEQCQGQKTLVIENNRYQIANLDPETICRELPKILADIVNKYATDSTKWKFSVDILEESGG